MTLRELLDKLDIDTKFVVDGSDSDTNYKSEDLEDLKKETTINNLKFGETNGSFDTQVKTLGAYTTGDYDEDEQEPYLFIGLDYDDFDKQKTSGYMELGGKK